MNSDDVIQNWSDKEIREITSRIKKPINIKEEEEKLPF